MKFPYIKLVILSISVILIFTAQKCDNSKPEVAVSDNTEAAWVEPVPIKFEFNDAYDPEWKVVDSLNRIGLYRSAYTEVSKIYEQARKDKNYPQVIKAQTHKLKYNTFLEEDDYIKAIAEMDSLTEHAEFPLKQLSHLLSAKIYWGFYSSNQYTIMNRTATEDFDNKDVRTWDLRKIAETITYHYVQATSQKDKLKLIAIEDFKTILTYNTSTFSNSLQFRPTLYDFLAHEALSFFQTAEFGISQNDLQFALDKPEYLSVNQDFVSIVPKCEDTLSNKYYAVKLLQDLTKVHILDKDPKVLIDITLKRLQFVKSNSTIDNKEELYLATLDKLVSQYKSHISVTEVMFLKASWYYSNSNINDSNDGVKYGKRTAYEICKKAEELFPSSYGAMQCGNLKRTIEKKSLSVQIENVMAPSEHHPYQITFKNIDHVYFKLLSLPKDYQQNKKNDKGIKHVVDQLKLDGTEIKSWSQATPNKEDFEPHTFNLTMEPLVIGKYCLIASPDSSFESKSEYIQVGLFSVTNFALTETKINNEEWKITVSNRMSGDPIVGAKVQLYKHVYNKDGYYEYIKYTALMSDKKGECSYKSGGYISLYPEVTKGGDYYFDFAGMYFSEDYKNEEYPSYQTHYFLDRKIYRPGQKVYFKGIMTKKYKGENTILANQKNNVIFYDVNYQKVAELKVTSNEYGSFSGEFTAPTTGMLGQMRISDSYGSVYFQVEEYKRPKFNVSFLPIEGSYKLNTDVTVKGNATAFAGNQIDGATVKYRVVRSANFPYWCWYRWGFTPNSATKEVSSGEAETDETGTFEITFNAKEDKSVNLKYSPTYSYIVYADVTDINGETRSGQTNVYVGKNALKLSINIPSEMDKQSMKYFNVTSTNLNGEKLSADVQVNIVKLKTPDQVFRKEIFANSDVKMLSKTEHDKLFPQDAYDRENEIQNYQVEKALLTKSVNTGVNDTVYYLPKNQWQSGQYKLTAKCIDEFGEEVYEEKYFEIYDPRDNKAHSTDVLWVKASKSTVEPGEFAKIMVSSKDNILVNYLLIKDGNIQEENILRINNEQKIISFPVKEADRGGFSVQFTTIKNERNYSNTVSISVPYTNKQLKVELATFRNKMLPGSEEEWKVKITGPNSEKVAAEMVAAMYDASLDEFAANYFSMHLDYRKNYNYYNYLTQSHRGFGITSLTPYNIKYNYNNYYQYYNRDYPTLNMFGYYPNYYLRGNNRSTNYYYDSYDLDNSVSYSENEVYEEEDSEGTSPPPPPAANMPAFAETTTAATGKATGGKDKKLEDQKPLAGVAFGTTSTGQDGQTDLSNVKARSNFSETAFFFPHLETNSKGEIIFSFTMPESLTKWKFMSLAHTKDLKVGSNTENMVTQKDLMVIPNAPRFFREGDKIFLSSKIASLAENELTGNVQLFLTDALTNQPIDELVQNTNAQQSFTVPSKQSTSVEWELTIPEGVQAISYKIVAQAGAFSDGEEMTLPVLSNRMLVTESIPLYINKKGSKTFKLSNLINSGDSKSLRHERVTIEFTSNPAWYAIQSLPYLMEYPYECAEQTFSRYYANSIASHVANSNPKIKAVFDSWKEGSKDAFLSNLEKNQELKALFLEETPWVMQAKSESESKKRVGLLFDLHRMDKELDKALKKIEEAQLSSGGWSWFKGMKPNRYITQHILCGMGHLNKMGIINSKRHLREWKMIKKAISYLDQEMVEDYEWLKAHHDNIYKLTYVGNSQLQYMYARSFFDTKMNPKVQEAHNYYLKMAKKYWLTNSLQTQAMLALTLERLEPEGEVQDLIMNSLTELAIHNEEMGMYYKSNVSGYYWYNSPIETQAMLIEAFDEVAKNDEAVEELKVWLLKQKQTTHWKTTKATAEACYALLLRGTDILSNDEIVEVKLGDMVVDPGKTEAGTGYYKKSYAPEEIKADMGNVTVTRKSTGVSWGGLYWQYFEDLDKIKTHETPLTIHKKLFKVQLNKDGEYMTPIEEGSQLKVGDKVRVRIEILTDRDLEYVHLKDMRAAGFEPTNVISKYKWQDGLGYYESTKDASTNFFMDFLAKGTYVFEYDLRVFHKGDFSNGITNMQCMYAPEFSSHSEGVRVEVQE